MRIFASAISTDASAIIIFESHTSMLTKTANVSITSGRELNWIHTKATIRLQPNALLPTTCREFWPSA